MTSPVPDLAALPVRDAVRSVLLADALLSGMLHGVLDSVPENQAFPYIALGDVVETPADAHDRFGSETLLTLHVWSRYRGFAQALTIAARVRQVLDHAPLTIPGHRWTWTRFVSLQTLTDPEPPGDVRHVPMTFRIGTEADPA